MTSSIKKNLFECIDSLPLLLSCNFLPFIEKKNYFLHLYWLKDWEGEQKKIKSKRNASMTTEIITHAIIFFLEHKYRFKGKNSMRKIPIKNGCSCQWNNWLVAMQNRSYDCVYTMLKKTASKNVNGLHEKGTPWFIRWKKNMKHHHANFYFRNLFCSFFSLLLPWMKKIKYLKYFAPFRWKFAFSITWERQSRVFCLVRVFNYTNRVKNIIQKI